jgi:hypothetical protein
VEHHHHLLLSAAHHAPAEAAWRSYLSVLFSSLSPHLPQSRPAGLSAKSSGGGFGLFGTWTISCSLLQVWCGGTCVVSGSHGQGIYRWRRGSGMRRGRAYRWGGAGEQHLLLSLLYWPEYMAS